MVSEAKKVNGIASSDGKSFNLTQPGDDISVEVPEILNIPPKLLPLITEVNQYRYFLIEGGRSGGKSQSIARWLLYLAEKYKLRISCGREIQNTIEESVYTIFKDLISSYKLAFNVLKTSIDSKISGTEIKFRGFREQGSVNIKGLEGVDILWVDEAQAITKSTLDVIVPTIRKTNSKVFFSMNRHIEDDPVYAYFINRPDCLHININYLENPSCPQKAIDEAEICKAKNLDDYMHIWIGAPLAKAEDYLFSMDMLRESIGLDMARIGISRQIMGNDVARYGDCETVFTLLKSHGPVQWEQYHQVEWKDKGGDEVVGKNLSLQKDFGVDAIVIDSDGMGGPVADMVSANQGFETIFFYATKDYESEQYADRRTEAYFKLKEWIEKGWLKILGDELLIEQLLAVRYKYTKDGKRIIEPKEQMRISRKKLFPNARWSSPDRADALVMAVFYADSLMGADFQDRNAEYATIEEGFKFGSLHPEYA